MHANRNASFDCLPRNVYGASPSTPDPNTLVKYEDQELGTVVFGVAVTQTPTCVETSTASSYFGSVTLLNSVSQAKFQLAYHTGSEGGADPQGALTRSATKDLPAPAGGVRIDSWASVVE